MTKIESTITITFGDAAENHKGMQIIGESSDKGFSLADLEKVSDYFERKDIDCTIYDLVELANLSAATLKKTKFEPAYLLVAKNGLSAICNPDNLLAELLNLDWDQQAFMYGRIVNKRARYNLCFSDFSQEADLANKQGTIIDFEDVPTLNQIRTKLPKILGPTARDLQAEGNYYYDLDKCFINYHGDSERRKVLAIRVGDTFPLTYQWFHQNEKIGDEMTFDLDHGDMYVMSEKAVGTDWKRKIVPTLRHAAVRE